MALGTVVWEHRQFSNPARGDGLQLGHWIKCLKDSAGEVRLADPGPYHFAKYDKKVRASFAMPLIGPPLLLSSPRPLALIGPLGPLLPPPPNFVRAPLLPSSAPPPPGTLRRNLRSGSCHPRHSAAVR